ncbi:MULTISPECIES: hypothetical protein [unclassified Microbacterium]|uniref:hypothetical protein n=1 Tax=unclassified Microbacterium TaxID=2609290 RepID=UPI001601A4F5|nr:MULTISPECIES: hypothetical protein [unclassified Microbacterium]MBT2484751.1 hypothetical protein [Microbacterium sp. ISL-108]
MANPKPITLTGDVPANHVLNDPQPFAVVAPGYDATETQTLQHVNGVVQWVTVVPPTP